MATDSTKAGAFVQRLLANPALQGLTPLQQEEQILQFLQVNGKKLYPTLSSSGFFPGSPWEKIWQILVNELVQIINVSLFSGIDGDLKSSLDMSFIPFLRQQNWPPEEVRDGITEFVKSCLSRPEIRREYTGVLSAIAHRAVDKYINQVYHRHEYVHFELTKVQRLKMSKEEVKNLIRVSMLLRPVIGIFISNDNGDGSSMLVQAHIVEKAFTALQQKLPSVPDQVLMSALNSNTSFIDNRYLEATARITAIFSALFRNLRQNMKLDRGADSPEKSWINVARKNFRFYGYDIKMLDEFYKIAAENGW